MLTEHLRSDDVRSMEIHQWQEVVRSHGEVPGSTHRGAGAGFLVGCSKWWSNWMDCGISHGIPFLDNTWELQLISLKRSPFGKVNSPVAYCLTIWNLHVLPFPSGCIPILIDDMVPIVRISQSQHCWFTFDDFLIYHTDLPLGCIAIAGSKPFVFKYVGLSKYRVYLYMVVALWKTNF